jgi:2-oxoglutarate ferredoxin oxidoreductase subunit beta
MPNLPNSFDTNIFPTWCPGCGDFAIWGCLKQAMVKLGWQPHQVMTMFGIGCSGNMVSFFGGYGFHCLHGRAIPTAAGAKLANHDLHLMVVAGDGDLLGEGLSHLVHGARANYDMTVILHNNQIYGLTTGQASPTTLTGMETKSTPLGVIDEPLNPSALAIEAKAGLVARGFAGDMPHLTNLIVKAASHQGFSLVEILQPCVTFNHLNTYEWFRSRLAKTETAASDITSGIKLAQWSDKEIKIGVLYQNDRPAFHRKLPQLDKISMLKSSGHKRNIKKLLESFR